MISRSIARPLLSWERGPLQSREAARILYCNPMGTYDIHMSEISSLILNYYNRRHCMRVKGFPKRVEGIGNMIFM